MITPSNRKEFEKHIYILVETIKQGNFHMVEERRSVNGLLNIRLLPNERVNFLTINESARLLANSLVTFDSPEFKKRKDAKK